MYNEDNGNVEEFGLRAGESYTFNGAPSGNYTMSAATPNGQIMWGPKHIYTLDPTYTYSFR